MKENLREVGFPTFPFFSRIQPNPVPTGAYPRFLKRPFDISLALIALLATLPGLLVVLVASFLAQRGNPFFLQERPGREARPFQIIKFRTMNEKTDLKGMLLPPGLRVTPLGRWLRKWSIDEIPQLFNVLKGEMSLVGPRPLLTRYLPRYNPRQMRRHEVRPGITGWAQVNGRNELDWQQKLEYDVWYVEHQSFALDVKIIFLTVRALLANDATPEGNIHDEFFGNHS
jgi:undecaprenyl phosphate N,N'-diacetylbacillosamine 1-phosphate transferase